MKSLIYEYEKYLIGEVEEIANYHFRLDGDIVNPQGVYVLIKYVVENIMHWTPEEANQFFNWEVAALFGLDKIIDRHIEFIPGMKNKEKCCYMISKCYPLQVHFDMQKVILRIYDDILSGNKIKWNKKFFNGKEGAVHACICMQAAINRYLYGLSVQNLYEYFGDYAQGMKFIRDVKLKKAFDKLYVLPIDFLHYSLKKEQRDLFLYSYFRFMNCCEWEQPSDGQIAAQETEKEMCEDDASTEKILI